MRHAAQSPNFDTEDDPLVELARIVSEDTGFQVGKGERAKAQREEPIDRNALSADLEAELLQELDASFAPRTPLRAVTPRARPAPAPPPPADDADELLRSIEEQLGAFERSAQAQPSAAAHPEETPQPAKTKPLEMRSDETAEARNADGDEEDLRAGEHEREGLRTRAADAIPDRPRRGPGVLLRAAAWPDRDSRPKQQRPEPRVLGEDADDGRQESGRESRRAARQLRRGERPIGGGRIDAEGSAIPASGIVGAAPGWDEIGREDENAVSAPEAASRWDGSQSDYRQELRTTFGDLDEAHEPIARRASDSDELEAGLAAELEPSYSDPSLGEHWQDEAYADAERPLDEPRVAVAAPGPLPRRGSQRNGSRKGLLVVAGVLGVAVLGGAAAFLMRGGDEAPSGPPPVISAQDGPVKVAAPDESGQAAEGTVGEAVYNRVAGRVTETEEQIVDSAEEPEEIPRIVMPAPQAEAEADVVRPVGDGDAEAGEAGADVPAGAAASGADAAPVEAPAGPRRVRTFVVRPDGSIVTAMEPPPGVASSASPAPEQGSPTAPIAEAEPIEPASVSTVSVDGAGEPDSAAAGPNPAGLSADAPVAAESAAGEAASTEAADAATGIRAGLEEPLGEAAGPAAAPADLRNGAGAEIEAPRESAAVEPPPARAAPAPSRARRDDSAPVDLLSNAAPREQAAPAPAAAAGGGWVVQISSQRTREEAQSSWDSMRGRYPAVLGSLQPSIQETDLGERGIYHRLRVGPWTSRAEAIEVCESLQAAGGSCFVAQ